MLLFYLLFGIFLLLYTNNDWKKIVTLFIILIPFLGFISNHLKPYSILASIFYDFALIIPIYFSLFTKKFETGYFRMIDFNLKSAFFFLIILVLIQFINPFSEMTFLVKLVGLKVWLFYFLLVPVGFYYINSVDEVIKLCKILSISAIIPCVVAVIQFILSFYIGYEETMNLFYPPEIARSATQNFTRFSIAPNIVLLRIPSTFASAAQFSNYLLFSFVPVLTAINFSNTNKEKFFYTLIFFLIILASIASGLRGLYIYIPIFFIYYSIFYVKPHKTIFYSFVIYVVIFIIYSLQFGNLNLLINYIQDLTGLYAASTLEDGFIYLLNNFLGNGIGTATFQTHFITGVSVKVGPHYNESYFFKVITELGFVGIIAIFIFYISILNALRNALKLQTNESIRILIASFIAFFLVMVTINFKSMHIDLFPSNILVYFFLGIMIKLNQIKNNELSKT